MRFYSSLARLLGPVPIGGVFGRCGSRLRGFLAGFGRRFRGAPGFFARRVGPGTLGLPGGLGRLRLGLRGLGGEGGDLLGAQVAPLSGLEAAELEHADLGAHQPLDG
ncbi:MAG: hypothetical protein C4332_01470, partial [Meiothermus sp.]